MARITIDDGILTVHMSRLDTILALRGTVQAPLSHIIGVTARPELPSSWDVSWWRMPGTSMPGMVRAGSFFHAGDGWYFFDVHDPEQSIAIELRDEHYKGLIVQVDGETPEEAARRIERAVVHDG